MRALELAVALGLGLAVLTACDRQRDQDSNPPAPRAGTPESAPPADTVLSKPLPDRAAANATAQLQPASGSQVSGTVTFKPTPEGAHIIAQVSGLTPGKHGFHIHQNGDCSAPDASSAGDHFNPDGKPHGGPETDLRHRGDLGNIEADSQGRAQVDRAVRGLTLTGPDSIVGKAVLVHEKEDDLKTPPSGNAGARVACGVIAAAG